MNAYVSVSCDDNGSFMYVTIGHTSYIIVRLNAEEKSMIERAIEDVKAGI